MVGSGRNAKLEIVEVPREFRPRIGAHAVSFQMIHERAETGWETTVAESEGLLLELISEMASVGAADCIEMEDAEIRRIMRLANDVRGAAQMMGADLITDIADTIFEVCESALPKGVLPKRVLVLLTQSTLRLVDYDRSADQGETYRQIQHLLGDIRAKISGTASQS